MIEIASHIELTQAARKCRRRQLVAKYFRWAVALSSIAFVLTAPLEAIYLLAVAFIPIDLSAVGLSMFLGYLAVGYIGIVLISSRKRPVLYLRHFGMSAESRRM